MSFSNADTGNKPADPYKAKNLDEPPLKEKIDGLVNFVATSKFGMLTTRSGSSGLLASRCMAVAGQVRNSQPTSPKPKVAQCFSLRSPDPSTGDTDLLCRKMVALI